MSSQPLSRLEWFQAIKEEYDALLKNNTWTLVDFPPNCTIVGCKWVFRI